MTTELEAAQRQLAERGAELDKLRPAARQLEEARAQVAKLEQQLTSAHAHTTHVTDCAAAGRTGVKAPAVDVLPDLPTMLSRVSSVPRRLPEGAHS